MVTNNKVLTVSYGTFSCTLEGFEESFDTMKAIAEYFRDLAADDRYFGAEPPTPDAEMLARIAEKEITRRVSARLDHGAIVLSAGEPKDQSDARPAEKEQHAAKATPAPVAQAEPEPQTAPEPVAEAPVIEEVVAQAAMPAVEDTPAEELIETPVEEVAEAVVEDAPVAAEEENVPSPVEETVAEDALVEEPMTEDTPAEVEAAVTEVAETEDPAPEVVSEGTPDLASEDNIADSVMAAIAEDRLPEAENAPIIAETEEVVEETAVEVASDIVEDTVEDVDLAGISAAVSAVDALSDDQLQTDSEADISNLLVLDAPVESNGEDPFAKDVAEDSVEAADWEDADDEPEFEENSIAAKLERIRAVVARVEAAPDTAAVDAEDDQPELTTAEAPADSNIFDEELAPMDLAPINLEDDHAVEVAAELSEDIVVPQAEVEDAEVVEAQAEEIEEVAAEPAPEPVKPKVRPLRARVVRMKKADFEDAVASGQLEASEDDDGETAQAPAPEAPKPTSLTPEDEADLLAELAQVEAELKLSDVAQAAPKAAPHEDAPVVLDTPIASEVETKVEPRQQPEPDLSRLMAKANSEMEEPQGKGRRSAIAHLRAAVAATRAEKRAGNDGKGKDDTVAYRDDLASVVRAVPGGKSGEAKPSKSAAAPLKLVAAQRVDATVQNKSEQPAQSETESVQKAPRRVPVRPRRVSSDQLDRDEAAKSAAPVSAKGSTLSGFADYAASMGAIQLPESTEAAAAYLTYVEGLERFSRPMLMRMSREVNIPQFTREEGLRAFGQLLRDKKIDKVAGGRFTANASINFKPRDSKAG